MQMVAPPNFNVDVEQGAKVPDVNANLPAFSGVDGLQEIRS